MPRKQLDQLQACTLWRIVKCGKEQETLHKKISYVPSATLIFSNPQSARTPTPLKALFASCYINSIYKLQLQYNSFSNCVKSCGSALICQVIKMADWSGLYHDLLVLIARSIASYEDFIALGGVCKSWRFAFKQSITRK